MKSLAAVVATVTAFAAPALAQAATMSADPAQPCYPEGFQLSVPGSGFSPNAQINFSRDGTPLVPEDPIVADAAGTFLAQLTLPGLLSGQQTLNYLATDSANTANTAQLSLLVTATDVVLQPKQGKPERLLRIRARGFFGGRRILWAHVARKGSRRSRDLKIGRIKGPCKKVRAKRRIFSAGAASGKYRVQFDGFKRYRKAREYRSVFNVTIFRTARPAAAAARAPSWRRAR